MNLLVRLFGFQGTLIAGDTLVWDRWRWLQPRLRGKKGTLLDIGCGSGAFTIGAARLGYCALGLSWDERNQRVAAERALLCGASGARFEVFDVRQLGDRADLKQQIDVAVCLENIEHILNDQKLISDIASCLRPGGRLLLTTPYKGYRAIGPNPDDGPFSTKEDGGHVRRGYQESDLRMLCKTAGLQVDNVSFCSGFLSQKITYLLRVLSRTHYIVAWIATLPLRLLPMVDPAVTSLLRWPNYSICVEAHKQQ